jgi:hypothetical protein
MHSWSPLRLLRKASQVSSVEAYAAVAKEFDRVNDANHAAWKEPNEDLLVKFKDDRQFVDKLTDRYQQIFFRFLDDVDDEVLNTFIDFLCVQLRQLKERGVNPRARSHSQ